MGELKRDRGSPPWPPVLLLALAHMMAFVDRFALSVVAAPVKTAFGLNDTRLGALQGLAFALPYAVTVIPFGRLVDRTGPRVLILAGLLLWTCASAGCAFAQSYDQAFACRMLMGVGQAAFTPAALALIGALFERGTVASPLSVFTAGSTMGKSVALLMGGAALAILSVGGGAHLVASIGAASWRGVFVLTAAPNLLLFAALLWTIRKTAGTATEQTSAPAFGWLVGRAGAFFGHAAVAIAPLILIQAAAAWTPLFYMRYFHLTAVRSALLVGSVVLLAAPTGHLIGGRLTARLARRGVAPGLIIAAMLAIVAPTAAMFCFAPALNLSLAAYGVMVLTLGVAAPAGLAGIHALTPRRRLGAGNGLFMCLVTLVGVGFAPTLVGAMNDSWYGGAAGLNLSLMTLVLFVAVPGIGLAIALNSRWKSGEAPKGSQRRDDMARSQALAD